MGVSQIGNCIRDVEAALAGVAVGDVVDGVLLIESVVITKGSILEDT